MCPKILIPGFGHFQRSTLLNSWKFENKPEEGEGGKTLVLRAQLVAIGAQKCKFTIMNAQKSQF